jgi:hypothetical protein
MQFFEVQVAVANQFSAQQQNRYFVPIAAAGGWIRIYVCHLDPDSAHLRDSRQFAQHLFAQAAAGA